MRLARAVESAPEPPLGRALPDMWLPDCRLIASVEPGLVGGVPVCTAHQAIAPLRRGSVKKRSMKTVGGVNRARQSSAISAVSVESIMSAREGGGTTSKASSMWSAFSQNPCQRR